MIKMYIYIIIHIHTMKKDFNLPQVNSVAPMALQSYDDFVGHDKTAYPFKPTSKLTPVFKVVLNSLSASVVNNNYTFNNLNFSDARGKILRLVLPPSSPTATLWVLQFSTFTSILWFKCVHLTHTLVELVTRYSLVVHE